MVNEYSGGGLICNGNDDNPNTYFTMNSGTVIAYGDYTYAIDSYRTNIVINGGVIQVFGDNTRAITNYGGNLTINRGEIKASGNKCTAITNEDFYNPMDANGQETPWLGPNRDTFTMNGGSVSSIGSDSVAISLIKNCTVSNGEIFASGKNSVGIAYHYVLDNKENVKQNINLLGGRILGESHALINKGEKNASYKNVKGEMVFVDSSVKEINLS